LVPSEWKEAEDLYEKAAGQFDKSYYENARRTFRTANLKYQDLLRSFDKLTREDSHLWLSWARQRANELEPGGGSWRAWLVVAAASRQFGEQDGYAEEIEKAVSCIKSHCITDPLAGVRILLLVPDYQVDCQDVEGARKTLRDAIRFCVAISENGLKANMYARCAGISRRLDDESGWQECLGQARTLAEQVGQPAESSRVLHPTYVRCIAYEESLAPEQAFTAAKEMQQKRSDNLKYVSPAFARVASSIARAGKARGSMQPLFEQSYVTACAKMACVLNPQWEDATFTRGILAQADARIGAYDRALAGLVNVPNPKTRAEVLRLIVRERVEAGDYNAVNDFLPLLPSGDMPFDLARWLGEAEARKGTKSMVELKRWAEQLPNAVDRAIALVGIAYGLRPSATNNQPEQKPLPDT
ncbi:MAG: hypothetical protein WCL11_27490, partial [Verrucomicrobiota bacterium]